MGKTKHSKRRYRPKAPTGIPSVQDTKKENAELGESENSASKKETAINTVIEQLQGSVEDKLLGLQSLASIFHSPAAVGDIIRRKISRITGPLLLDPSSTVRNAAAGALRNLSSSGDPVLCELLLDQDVMTPLTAVIHKSAREWDLLGAAANSEVTDTFVQAVHLLWNLCENKSTAVQYFNDSQLLRVLIPCLDITTLRLETALAVAQCLLTVTEDNPTAIAGMREAEPLLQKLLSLPGDGPEVILLRILAVGLILNLQYGQASHLPPALTPQLLAALAAGLTCDQRLMLNTLTSNLPLEAEYSAPETRTVEEAQRLLEAQQTAVEIITNLCSGDDSDDDAMEQDSSDMSDSISEPEIPEEDLMHSQVEACPLSLPTEIHEGIISLQLVQKIWDKTILPPENVCSILKEHPGGEKVYKKVCMLRCRALLCLSNLVSSMGLEELGGSSSIYKMWVNTGNIIFKQADSHDTQLLEAATALMRATLQRLAESKTELLNQLEESDLQLMFSGELQCPDVNVRGNLIRIVATLGTIVATSPEEKSQVFLKSIGRFLLDAGCRETQLWLIAEVLDAIMDVFGEDETDRVTADLCLVERLRMLLPTFKSKVRLQKKSLGEHYLVVTTVNRNLARFIQYKANRVAQLQSGT